MYYSGYQQNDEGEQQYRVAKEAVRAAMNILEQLQPDQQRRLLHELAQEKVVGELLRRMQMHYPQK